MVRMSVSDDRHLTTVVSDEILFTEILLVVGPPSVDGWMMRTHIWLGKRLDLPPAINEISCPACDLINKFCDWWEKEGHEQ